MIPYITTPDGCKVPYLYLKVDLDINEVNSAEIGKRIIAAWQYCT